MHVGLTVRSHLINILPIHSRKWVTVTRLPYGTPKEAVDLAFRQFGPITRIRIDAVNGISTGDFSLLMEVRTPIPCRVTVNGHSSYTRYRGQKQTCYRCGQEGHVVQNCPKSNRSADPPGAAFVGTSQVTTATPVWVTAPAPRGATSKPQGQAPSTEARPPIDDLLVDTPRTPWRPLWSHRPPLFHPLW